MNEDKYIILKREIQGFYFKFNTEVLRFHMNKIFDYEYLLETAKSFSSFEKFYNFHTQSKKELIDYHVEKMVGEAHIKKISCNETMVRSCLMVRLGNVYTGMWIENKILETFNSLSNYITCNKTEKEIDILYKVDGVVELVSIDKFAIQIKPISFLRYDKGSEKDAHKRFELEFGPKVYYVFYKNKNTIVLDGETIDLNNKNKIVEKIENILM